MRYARGLATLLGVTVTAGCLSETLIDNYDARAFASQSGGQSAVQPDYSSNLPVVLPTSTPTGQPMGVVVPIPRMNAASGGSRATVDPTTGGTSMGFGASGGTSNANPTGASGIRQATQIPHHRLERYIAFELLDGSGSDIGLGVTAADHLIALVSTNVAPYMGSGNAMTLPGLLEVLPTGESLRHVVFWGGARPDAFVVQPNGTVVLSGRLDNDVNYGGSTIKQLEHGYFLVKLDADWNPVFELGVPTDGDVTPSSLVVDADGRIRLALRKTNSIEVAEFAADGTPNATWTVVTGSALKLNAMADDGAGQLLFAGQFDTTLDAGAWAVESSGMSDGWIGSWSSSSRGIESVGRLGGAGYDAASGILPGANGARQVAAVVSGNATLFGVNGTLSSRGAPLVIELDPSGNPSWITQLASEGTVLDFTKSANRTYVAGTLRGWSAKSGQYRNQLYVTELGGDGSASSFFTIDANGAGPTHLAVDSRRTIWLSGRANVVPAGGIEPKDCGVLLQLVQSGDEIESRD